MKVKDLKGTFNCTAILHSDNVLENAQIIAENIISSVQAQGGVAIREGNIIRANNGQFWKLPILPKERKGLITFRSKDYMFEWDDHVSFGNFPKLSQLTNNGFVTTMFNGDKIEYIFE